VRWSVSCNLSRRPSRPPRGTVNIAHAAC